MAGSKYIGQPAIYHQDVSPDCWRTDQTLQPCLEAGLGERDFDCSGLVIRAMCDVMGRSTNVWPMQLRHTRQLWQAVLDAGAAQPIEEARVGDVIVCDRLWTMPDGTHKRVAAHISIKGYEDKTLQAQANDRQVVYRPPHIANTRIGSFTVVALESLVQQVTAASTLDDRVLKALS